MKVIGKWGFGRSQPKRQNDVIQHGHERNIDVNRSLRNTNTKQLLMINLSATSLYLQKLCVGALWRSQCHSPTHKCLGENNICQRESMWTVHNVVHLAIHSTWSVFYELKPSKQTQTHLHPGFFLTCMQTENDGPQKKAYIYNSFKACFLEYLLTYWLSGVYHFPNISKISWHSHV